MSCARQPVPVGSLIGSPLPNDARPFLVKGVRCGFEWTDTIGRFCLLTHLLPSAQHATRAAQTLDALGQVERMLSLVGMDYANVLRTWFYLEDILEWYDDFNRVRTAFYEERSLCGRCPASTAVGMSNPEGRALLVHVLALQPTSPAVQIGPADSPSQGSALDYGSTFSRATKVNAPNKCQLFISGTASIGKNGDTLFPESTKRQAQETFDVVSALLARHGFGFEDVTCATGYLPTLTDRAILAPLWTRDLSRPLNLYQADICRRDLRFELELLAEKHLSSSS